MRGARPPIGEIGDKPGQIEGRRSDHSGRTATTAVQLWKPSN
jgi:hypothetical protein